MPAFPSLRRATGTLWRGVLSAASKGQSVWQTVTGIGRRSQQAGLPPEQIDTSQVDQMFGLAGDWVSATEAVANAADETAVTSGMVTMAPWSMSLPEFLTAPGYHLVLGINVEGQSEPVYRTVTGITDLPATVGDLRDLALSNAYAMAVGTTPGGGVGGTVTGVSSVTVTVAPAGA